MRNLISNLKKLLLIPFFLFAPIFSGPQDAGLHLFGPQNKIVDFNAFNEVIGEFNCTTGELKVNGGNDIGELPLNKWISKQDLVDIYEPGNKSFSAKQISEMNYSFIKDEGGFVCE